MMTAVVQHPPPVGVSVDRQAQVAAALDTVIDPEVDEPITDLGFVMQSRVDGAHVAVRLRLPTAFCSPNFAFLMVSDAHDALSALPWTASVQVTLQDHHDAEQINRGVAKTSYRSLVKLDDALEPADVAALADAGLTAYHAVAKAARQLDRGRSP